MSQSGRFTPTSGPGSGTVTSISAGTGITLTPNPITTTGTVALTIPVTIADGGTNAITMANTFGVNYFDGTSIVTTSVGTATQILTSNGAGVAPTFQNAPASGVTSITGNTGTAQTGAINLVTLNSSPVFAGLAGTITLDFALTNNLLLGSSGSITSGQENSFYGYESGVNYTTGSNSTAIGAFSMYSAIAGASDNTAIDYSSLHNLAGAGIDNIAIGVLSGSAFTTNESDNIIIGSLGVIADQNTIRIGTQGSGGFEQNLCFIAGITGVNVGSVANVVSIATATGQLGETAITAGTGITVTPGANTITIAATGGGSGITTVDGDTGSVTGSTVTFNANSQAGSSVSFSGSGTTMSFNTTDAADNVIIGSASGNGSITGNFNVCLGVEAMTALTTANYNQSIGTFSCINLQSGTNNISFGCRSGENWSSNESNNILIASDGAGSGSRGTMGDQNVLRIGCGTGSGAGQIATAIISGISGVDVGSVATVVTEAGDQLGTAVITAGTGITVTPGANTITIAATGGGSGITTIDGDVGSVTGSTITITGGTTGLTFSGSGTTLTLESGSLPAFNAYLQTSLTNVTGGGSEYLVIFDSVSFDQTSSYNTSTGLFTAPQTGKYMIGCHVCLSNVTSQTNFNLYLNPSSGNAHSLVYVNPSAIMPTGSGLVEMNGSTFLSLTSGDTVSVYTEVGSTTNTVGLLGNDAGQMFTEFWAYLVC